MEETVTTWTCARCRREAAIPQPDIQAKLVQPELWVRVMVMKPPTRGVGNVIGDLCTECAVQLVAFINGGAVELPPATS